MQISEIEREIEHETEEKALVTDRVLNTKSKIEVVKKTQNTGNVSIFTSPPFSFFYLKSESARIQAQVI